MTPMQRHLVGRFEADNALNRLVLEALEEGRIRTHLNNVDTTESDKALYRERVAELDDLLSRTRAGRI